jgi:hypothetical protein
MTSVRAIALSFLDFFTLNDIPLPVHKDDLQYNFEQFLAIYHPNTSVKFKHIFSCLITDNRLATKDGFIFWKKVVHADQNVMLRRLQRREEEEDPLRCLVCEVNLKNESEYAAHCNETEHTRNVQLQEWSQNQENILIYLFKNVCC